MARSIKSYFKSIEEKEITLLLVPEIRLAEVEIDIVKYLNKKGYFTIYINANKPYATMANIFKKEGIDLNKVFFIDLITQFVGADAQRAGNCIFCSPRSLTNLSIIIKSVVENLPKDAKKVLFFDSLSTLLLYNESATVSRFAHMLIARLREWKLKGMVLMLQQETDKTLITQIASFCDNYIKTG